ncbi:MAG: ShlB/FhaC/HecB family hemolysin secretion/activation protein [Gammaproteobacteria bacterium]
MSKRFNFAKLILKLCIVLVGSFFYGMSFAAVDPATQQTIKNTLPGSTEPGVVSNIFTPKQEIPKSLPRITPPQEQPSSLGPQATQIKFKLTRIIIDDNHVYSEEQLSQLYKDKINTEISVAQLQEIVQSITNFYRNNGYILSRAILPPQHVTEGIVHVQVIEGYIDQVKVIGFPKGARALVQAYGDKIANSKPLQIKVMENYLRLANEVPGMQVKAVLEPSKTNTGASNLNLSAEEQTINGYLSYDNYGTRYIGPNQVTGNASLNSIFRSGDSTHAVYATTSRPQQLKFFDISYQTPIGTNGFYATLGGNSSKTQPGMNLATIDINGNSTTYYGLFQYPMIRSREKNLSLDGGFNYLDSQVTSFNFPLYTDHIRAIKAGANYDFSDRFHGSNLLGLHLEQGLNIFGASHNPDSLTTSRPGATGVYTKVVGQVARLQAIYGRLSAYAVANGQYSYRPLLASVQFGFGGSQLGRGYDPAEIIGDKGMSGSLELRMDWAPGWFLLKAIEPYIFYDAGEIWNLKDVIGVKSQQSATSTGFGTRFVFSSNFTGNLMITQPLTKSVTAMELIGRGRNPRGFFSVVAAV